EVTGTDSVGGLIGYSTSNNTIKSNYAAVKINSTGQNKGGIVGGVYYNRLTITNCYYDSTVTGLTTPEDQAKITEDLLNKTTYTNWNFENVWNIKDGNSYPFLQNVSIPEHEYMPIEELEVPNITVNEITINKITFNWNEINRATSYDIEVDGNIINNGNSTSYEHIGLDANTEHTYKVRAKAKDFIGEWSEDLTVKTAIVGIPSNIVIERKNTSINIIWNSVENATGYDIKVDGEVINNDNNTNYEHINLIPETEHTYKVRAKNSNGAGDWSEEIIAKTVTELTVPQNIVTVKSDISIKLLWDKVTGAEGYDIEVDGNVIDTGISTSYEHLDLTPNTEHKYKVRAKAGSVIGEWSEELVITTWIVGIPTNIKTTGTETSITISWDSVLDATSYDIEVDGQLVDNGNSLSYQHTGLQQNTNHKYKVRAKKSDAIGEWSEIITSSTLLTGAIIIKNKEELKQIANDLAATYVLGNDIDLENEEWEPIGNSSVPFSGVFDGRGYKISN
uniref:fibronectin type III domain-containing protein n=1 Tax=Anaerovorax odorimutans TaxID=109327 RepID=UPI0004868A55